MKSSTKDKAQGVFHQVKGQIKESVGKISSDVKMETEGKGEKLAGKVQAGIGKVEKALKK